MLKKSSAQSGQAQVEAALTLPLLIFMVLGTIQLFMVMQGRILAQYAAYSAARVGALSKGDCTAMSQAAGLILLPTVTNTEDAGKLTKAYLSRLDGQVLRYKAGVDGFDGPLVEIYRERPLLGEIRGTGQDDNDFDDFTAPKPSGGLENYTLELRMAFWFHLRIPFADWVIARIFLAHYGLQAAPVMNPLMPVAKTSSDPWNKNGHGITENGFGHGSVGARMKAIAGGGHYVVPIVVNATMPMMTPPDRGLFAQPQCPI